MIATLLALAAVGRLTLFRAAPAPEPMATAAPEIAYSAASLAPEVRLAHAKAAIDSARNDVDSSDDDCWKARALGSIAAAQAGAGDLTASRQTSDRALQTAHRVKDGYYSPQDVALKSIAGSQAKAGDLSGGLQTAQSMKDAFFKASALEFVAAAQAKAGDVKASRQTFAQALHAVQNISDDSGSLQDDALQSIAVAQARAGDLSGGYHTAKNIQDDSLEAYALDLAGAAYAKAGDTLDSREAFDQALRTAQSMHDVFAQADALVYLAAAQAKSGGAPASAPTFDLALRVAQGIKIEYWKSAAFGRIAAAQAKAGDVSGAFRTAAKIKDDRAKPDALSSIASAQAKAGNGPASRQTFAQALHAARNLWSDGEKADALSGIAVAQAGAGDLAASRQTFTEALEAARGIEGSRPDGPPYVALDSESILTAQAKADVLGAEKTVRTLHAGKDRCNRYIEIAEALLEGPHASEDEES